MHKRLVLACLALFSSNARGEEARSAAALTGYWEGAVHMGAVQLRLGLHLSTASGTLEARVDAIDQGALDVLSVLTFTGDTLHIDAKPIRAKFHGALCGKTGAIIGTLHQAGFELPLTFRKLEKVPDRTRPQDPKKPYPYHEEEVVFENKKAKIRLAGTLTRPRDGGPHPAVVLISGSGPQDRDGSAMGHRPLLILADHLTRQGNAVLRFDDRGVGKSTGVFHEATSADFATDALAAVSFLRKRKDVDPRRIGLLGHSEGGLISPLAAVASKEVAFIILLAGPGLPGEAVVERQLEVSSRMAGMSAKASAWNLSVQKQVVALLRKETDDKKASAQLAVLLDTRFAELDGMRAEDARALRNIFDARLRLDNLRWNRFFLTHDPRPVLRKVSCPVLALNGEKDVQVHSRTNLAAIKLALTDGGNRDHTVKEFAGVNHVFQKSKTGSIAEYGLIQTTIEPEVLACISDWMKARAK